MADPIQHGTDVEVGIGDMTYAGTIVQEAGLKPTADEENIQDEDGSTATELFWDPGAEIRLRTIVESGAAAAGLSIGDVITVNTIKYSVRDVDEVRVGRVMRLDIQAAKKDSITFPA